MGMESGQRVKDKFNGNDTIPAKDMRKTNPQARPNTSKADHPVDGSGFLDSPTDLDPHNASSPSDSYEDVLRAQVYAHIDEAQKHREDTKARKTPEPLKMPEEFTSEPLSEQLEYVKETGKYA